MTMEKAVKCLDPRDIPETERSITNVVNGYSIGPRSRHPNNDPAARSSQETSSPIQRVSSQDVLAIPYARGQENDMEVGADSPSVEELAPDKHWNRNSRRSSRPTSSSHLMWSDSEVMNPDLAMETDFNTKLPLPISVRKQSLGWGLSVNPPPSLPNTIPHSHTLGVWAGVDEVGNPKPSPQTSRLPDKLDCPARRPNFRWLQPLPASFTLSLVPSAAASVIPDGPIGKGIPDDRETSGWTSLPITSPLLDLTLRYLLPFTILATGAGLAYLRGRETAQPYRMPKFSRVVAGSTAVASFVFFLLENQLGPVAASISLACQIYFMTEHCFGVGDAQLYIALDLIFSAILTLIVAAIMVPSTVDASTNVSWMTLVVGLAVAVGPGVNALIAWLLFLVLQERPSIEADQPGGLELEDRPGEGEPHG